MTNKHHKNNTRSKFNTVFCGLLLKADFHLFLNYLVRGVKTKSEVVFHSHSWELEGDSFRKLFGFPYTSCIVEYSLAIGFEI